MSRKTTKLEKLEQALAHKMSETQVILVSYSGEGGIYTLSEYLAKFPERRAELERQVENDNEIQVRVLWSV